MYTTLISFVLGLFGKNNDDKNGYNVKIIIYLFVFIFIVLPIMYFAYTSITSGFRFLFNIKTTKEKLAYKTNEVNNLKTYNKELKKINILKDKINKVNEEVAIETYDSTDKIEKVKDKIVAKINISKPTMRTVKEEPKLNKDLNVNPPDVINIIINKKDYEEEGKKNIDALWEMYNNIEGVNSDE